MNILMFQLLSILPHLMHGGERQSPNAAKPKEPLIVHCEPHPKRETQDDTPPLPGQRGAWMETSEAALGTCRLGM